MLYGNLLHLPHAFEGVGGGGCLEYDLQVTGDLSYSIFAFHALRCMVPSTSDATVHTGRISLKWKQENFVEIRLVLDRLRTIGSRLCLPDTHSSTRIQFHCLQET